MHCHFSVKGNFLLSPITFPFLVVSLRGKFPPRKKLALSKEKKEKKLFILKPKMTPLLDLKPIWKYLPQANYDEKPWANNQASFEITAESEGSYFGDVMRFLRLL